MLPSFVEQSRGRRLFSQSCVNQRGMNFDAPVLGAQFEQRSQNPPPFGDLGGLAALGQQMSERGLGSRFAAAEFCERPVPRFASPSTFELVAECNATAFQLGSRDAPLPAPGFAASPGLRQDDGHPPDSGVGTRILSALQQFLASMSGPAQPGNRQK
jgi:hypothetical protein